MAAVICLSGCSSKEEVSQTEPGFGKSVIRIEINDYGSVDIRLFDNDSASAYDSFLEMIENGSYSGAKVGTLIEDYLLAFECEDIVPEKASTTPNPESGVYPIYGSIVLSDAYNENGSFMIIASDSDDIKELEEMLHYRGVTLSEYILNAYGTRFEEDKLDLYREKGGAPWLYGRCVCIGQVFDGMDLVEKMLLNNSVKDNSYVPLDELTIASVKIAE